MIVPFMYDFKKKTSYINWIKNFQTHKTILKPYNSNAARKQETGNRLQPLFKAVQINNQLLSQLASEQRLN